MQVGKFWTNFIRIINKLFFYYMILKQKSKLELLQNILRVGRFSDFFDKFLESKFFLEFFL
jgi:hypothetical protein